MGWTFFHGALVNCLYRFTLVPSKIKKQYMTLLRYWILLVEQLLSQLGICTVDNGNSMRAWPSMFKQN